MVVGSAVPRKRIMKTAYAVFLQELILVLGAMKRRTKVPQRHPTASFTKRMNG
jgi:hypothetical protein